MAAIATNYFTTKTNSAMKIFMTGTTGYIGNQLALKLANSKTNQAAIITSKG